MFLIAVVLFQCMTVQKHWSSAISPQSVVQSPTMSIMVELHARAFRAPIRLSEM